jgi:hypothetical protein
VSKEDELDDLMAKASDAIGRVLNEQFPDDTSSRQMVLTTVLGYEMTCTPPGKEASQGQ